MQSGDPGGFGLFVLGERGAHLIVQGVQCVADLLAVGVYALGDLLVLAGQFLAEPFQVGLGFGYGVGDAGNLLAAFGGGDVGH
ncbi:hypothetical protein D3C80_1198020 [compost metagenome]